MSERLIMTRRAMLVSGASLLALSACETVALDAPVGEQTGSTSAQVALLVPSGTGDPAEAAIAQSLENAARLAIADLGSNGIDLRIYSAGSTAAAGTAAATTAVSEGANIILGPLYAEAANAAAVAARPAGVNVLSFSNNTSIAGGNLFVLGTTFDTVARRLANYAARQGKKKVFVVHANTPAESLGRDAIVRALSGAGLGNAGVFGFEPSQNGVVQAATQIAAQVKSSGADSIFFTSPTDLALPFLAELLPNNGISPASYQFIGLTRWDVPATAPGLTGLQGGWFAAPDPALAAQFRSRYVGSYGNEPHSLAPLAYDGIAAIGALLKTAQPLGGASLVQSSGYAGVSGIFRLRNDGTNERGLAIARIQNRAVEYLEAAPRSFAGAGF